MNVVGIGIDAVEISRFKKAIDQRGEGFLSKVFTRKELEYAENKKAAYMHMAGKFAAKEAVKKKFNLSRVLVSISHTRDLATSNAVVVSDGT